MGYCIKVLKLPITILNFSLGKRIVLISETEPLSCSDSSISLRCSLLHSINISTIELTFSRYSFYLMFECTWHGFVDDLAEHALNVRHEHLGHTLLVLR